MTLQQVFDNITKSRDLIAEYADLDHKIWQAQLYVKNYNRKKLFNILSLGITALLLYITYIADGNLKNNWFPMLYAAPFLFLIFRVCIGDLLDFIKRIRLKRRMKPEIIRLSEKMDVIADRLDAYTVLPSKYRTLHAVNAIGGYFVNERAHSLKEAINLYEQELFYNQQLGNQQMQMQQNGQIIQQNQQMIQAQRRTNRLLYWSR